MKNKNLHHRVCWNSLVAAALTFLTVIVLATPALGQESAETGNQADEKSADSGSQAGDESAESGSESGDESADSGSQAADKETEPRSRSGYDNIRPVGGPASVSNQLRADAKIKTSVFRFNRIQNALQPYDDFKARMKKDHALTFGLDYSSLAQWATSSLTDEDSAYGGNFRVYGQWGLVGRGGRNEGGLVWKIENRSAYGDSIVPEDLGPEIGLVAITTIFNDWGWGITNLEWQQHFNDGKSFVAFGPWIDVTDWFDIFILANPWTGIKNSAIVVPTASPPNQGFGVMAFSMFGEHIYAQGGVSDANGQPNESLDFNSDSFFDVREYFTWGEVGYVATEEQIYFDNIHFSVWHQDEKTIDGVTPEGWGASASATWKLKDQWRPFLRLGWSDGGGGALAKAAVTVGTGIDLRNHDELAMAVNWSKPSIAGLRDSVTLETYYRFQLSRSIAVWPNVMVIFRPANNPNEDVVAVFSLTGRMAF